MINTDLSRRTEIRVDQYDHIYAIRINPVKLHSAGIYICEDDVSQSVKITHNANITLHVIGKFLINFIIQLTLFNLNTCS